VSLYAGTSEIIIPSTGYVVFYVGRLLQSLSMILIQSGARAEIISYLLLSVDSQGILLHICKRGKLSRYRPGVAQRVPGS
jgi:hypothetical protein